MDNSAFPSIYQDPKYKEVMDKTLNDPQLLQKATVIYSNILNRHNDKLYLINKIKDVTPSFPLDWDMYLLLKAHSRVLLTSGQILRDETAYKMFHNHDVFYNKAILDYFKERNPQKQKVFVFSNSISTDKEVNQYINADYYEPILIKQHNPASQFKTIPQQDSLNGYLEKLLQMYQGPILIEFGLTTLCNYLESTPKNLIDFFIVTQFVGPIPEECRGKQLHLDLDKYFNVVHKSDYLKHQDGSIVFTLYGPKTAS